MVSLQVSPTPIRLVSREGGAGSACRFVVATFNLGSGRHAAGAVKERVRAAAAGLSADVCLFQEVWRGVPGRSMDPSGAVAAERGGWSRFLPALGLGRTGYGLSALSGLPVMGSRRHRLPGWGEPRVLLRFELRVADHAVEVWTTHLAPQPQWRRRQLEALAGLRRQLPPELPVLLAGDLNLRPDGAGRDVLEGAGFRFPDHAAPTYPAVDPRLRLDWVLVSGGLRLHREWVVDPGVSDHRAVFGEVGILPGAGLLGSRGIDAGLMW